MAIAVRMAIDADRPELLRLLAEMIPDDDPQARLDWLYDANPSGPALTWLAIADGEPAGCTSFFPYSVVLDGEVVRAALGGDGYVRPRFRRRGIGGMLHEASRDAMMGHRLGCMYGAPGAMNLTPLKHGGSREIGTVSRWVRPLRGAAIGLAAAPFDGLVKAAMRPRSDAEVVPMERHDPRVEDVWGAARTELVLAAVRDAAFYTWRFLDAPAKREPAFVIVRADKPIGACALESMGRGRDLRIVDLIAVPDEWHACLAAIDAYGATTGAATVDIKLMSLDGRRRRMWQSAFTEREAKPFLVMIPKHGDRRFLDAERWFYSGADSDLDSLE
jgi:GNAT superfamily N-acetyltransferase